MVNKDQQLLASLEKHIDDLGREFSRMALDFFWMEEDIRAWLFAQLCQDPDFTYSIGDSSVPIFHAHYPTRSVPRQFYDLAVVESDDAKLIAERKKGKTQFYDLSIVESDDAKRIDEWKKGKSQNRFEEKDAQLLAAIEIGFLWRGGKAWWPKKLEGDVDKLKRNKEQFKQGYLLVFVLTEYQGKERHNYYSAVKAYLHKMVNKPREEEVNLKIYCRPGPAAEKEPFWI